MATGTSERTTVRWPLALDPRTGWWKPDPRHLHKD